MCYKAKRRDAAGKHVGAREEEGHCADILAQEVAELLGQAMENRKQVSENRWVEQESFTVSIHGTKLKITAAYFSAEYLHHVSSRITPTDQVLWVRRTGPLDLREPAQRAQALRWLIGLVAFMYSGEAEIALLKQDLST